MTQRDFPGATDPLPRWAGERSYCAATSSGARSHIPAAPCATSVGSSESRDVAADGHLAFRRRGAPHAADPDHEPVHHPPARQRRARLRSSAWPGSWTGPRHCCGRTWQIGWETRRPTRSTLAPGGRQGDLLACHDSNSRASAAARARSRWKTSLDNQLDRVTGEVQLGGRGNRAQPRYLLDQPRPRDRRDPTAANRRRGPAT